MTASLSQQSSLYVTILAGGSGTRFWPLSRSSMPKQLISVAGGPSMLQKTVERVLPLNPARILVVTSVVQAEETERQLLAYDAPIQIIKEPCGKNTAPAIGLAALVARAADDNAVMLVLPADHYVTDEEGFRRTVLGALVPAADGFLVTLGIEPTRPETGYGYLQTEAAVDGVVRKVLRFVEKPPLETALRYLSEGGYYWNSGIFAWRSDVILQAISRYMPSLFEVLSGVTLPPDVTGGLCQKQIEEVYPRIAGESIDYGVMEKADKVVMVPASFGWSDVGSWSALPEILPADERDNVFVGTVASVSLEASGNIVHCREKLVALLGVDDLVVVDSGDALLITRRDKAQDVKKIVETLAVRKLSEYL